MFARTSLARLFCTAFTCALLPSALPAGASAKAQLEPRLYVANTNARWPTVAVYDLQTMALLQTSVTAGTPITVLPDFSPWWVSSNFGFAGLRPTLGKNRLWGFEVYRKCTGAVVSGVTGLLVVVNPCLNEIDIYNEYLYGKTRKPDAVYTGGGIGPSAGTPVRAVFDNSGNVWAAADSNSTFTKFGKDGSIAVFQYPSGSKLADLMTDVAGNVWVVYQLAQPNITYFASQTSCVPVQSGPVTRYAIGSVYAPGGAVLTMYGLANQNPAPAHLAVDSTGRGYISTSHQVLDYDPQTGCPNPALTLSQSAGARAPLALDASDNLYVADPGPNTVTEYQAHGSIVKVRQLTQPAGQSIPYGLAIH